MELWHQFVDFISKNEKGVPKGICPNCWGRQEYGGKFFIAMHEEGINSTNAEYKKGWIRAYVDKNLSGIELKVEDDESVCKNCSVSYKRELKDD